MRYLPFVVVLGLVIACSGSPTAPTQTVPSIPAGDRLRLELFPTYGVLRSGSTVRVTAIARDGTGANAAGAVVRFTTTAGTIEPGERIVNGAGHAEAVLTAADAATVTVTYDGLTQTIAVAALAPFAVRISGPATVILPSAWTGSVALDQARGIVNPPLPTTVTFTCGNGVEVSRNGMGTGLWSQHCALAAGEYTLRTMARASNGWTTEATSRITVSPAPVVPPPPAPATPPGVTIDAVEIHTTNTSATWRFTATPQNGAFTANLDWNFDYTTQDPSSALSTKETRTTVLPDTDEDVIYNFEGIRQIRVTTQVAGQAVTATRTITVDFP